MFMDIKVGVKMDKHGYKEYLSKVLEDNSKLEKQVLELTIENAELKDKLINYNHHAPTDGLEVGNPEDYEDDGQLDLFDVSK